MGSIEQLQEGTRPWGSATLCQRRILLDGSPGGGIQTAHAHPGQVLAVLR
jgi:hypothetical protein